MLPAGCLRIGSSNCRLPVMLPVYTGEINDSVRIISLYGISVNDIVNNITHHLGNKLYLPELAGTEEERCL